MARVVVDTNVMFLALMSAESSFAKVLLRSGHSFFICETTLVNFFEHKEKLVGASRTSPEDIALLYYLLVKRVPVYKGDLIAPKNWKAAYALCADIDETDTPHIAFALPLKSPLWTGDKRLKEGLEKKGFKNFFVPGTR